MVFIQICVTFKFYGICLQSITINLFTIATIPVADNICHSQTVEGVQVNGCESLSRNSRLGTLPCNERYASIAWTANSGALPWPIYTKQPLRKGSVLET